MFAKQYAEAKDVAVSAVWGLVMGTVTASGIPEAIAAAILVLAIGKVLLGVFPKNEYWKCCESKCIEERRPPGSRKRAGRSSFAMYLYERKSVTGSVDTKKQKFCKKIKKLKNSVDRCMINMV